MVWSAMSWSLLGYEHLFVQTVPVAIPLGKHVFDFYLTPNKCSGLVEQVFVGLFLRTANGCHTPVAQLNRWLIGHKRQEV
ncbi:MAG: hypothetical protein CNE88_08105 [Acidimicrobiales bacterium MED-G01]|nr:MAG: hypothetical protein CNE88_08105 [Acidimicrobiales bacterium MED-G01]